MIVDKIWQLTPGSIVWLHSLKCTGIVIKVIDTGDNDLWITILWSDGEDTKESIGTLCHSAHCLIAY